MVGGTSLGGGGVSLGVDFGPYLVDGWQGGGIHGGGGAKPKVLSSLNHSLLQYYFAPYSKAVISTDMPFLFQM